MYWSQNARFYTMAQFISLAGAALVLRGLWRGRAWLAALGLAIAGSAALLHPSAGLMLPALFDLEHRKKIVDGHKDYQQILSYPQPPIEKFAKTPADIDEFCRIINDGFAELCAKEKDHFPGWVAHLSLAAPDAGVGLNGFDAHWRCRADG